MSTADIAELRARRYNATVTYLKKVNPDLAILRLRPDFPVPPHKAGQYGTIGLGQWEPRAEGCQPEITRPGDEEKLIRRAYSISCPVLDDAGQHLLDPAETRVWLEFYIVLVREAEKAPPALTPRIFSLKQGDRIFFGEKIAGHFTLDPVKPDDVVLFLSTGTGEAPHNYMLWELLRRGHAGPILSACCVRYRQDLGYIGVHEELMRRHANYSYLPLTTREPHSIHQKVYIQDLITSGQLEERIGRTLHADSTQVFLCGNPKMIGVPKIDRATGATEFPQPLGVVEILSRRGFQIDQPALKRIGNIHYEEYW